MAIETLVVKLDTARREAIDRAAAESARSREEIFGDAVDVYLELRDWQLARLNEAIRQADAGEFATDEEIAETFAQLRQRGKPA